MKLFFTGTRGEIEEESPRHKYHSSLVIEEKGVRLLIDIGSRHPEALYGQINTFDAILITHAHPDHYLWTVTEDGQIKAPVYLTEISLDYSRNRPANPVVIKPEDMFRIGHFEITAYNVIHSLRCPAVCFKISGLQKCLVYAPDILDTVQPKEKVFSDIEMLVSDGSSFDINLVRSRDGRLFGHAMIKTIINWCRNYNIKKLAVTHCGKQIVGGDEEEIINKIEEFAGNNVNVVVAFDGMTLNM